MLSLSLSVLLLATASATTIGKVVRQECKPCNPQGATGSNPPSVGPELNSLYLDVLESVKDIHFDKRWEDAVAPRADSFCCRENLDCVNVVRLNIPMCYDKFTTNFAFPGNTWGSLTTGEYEAGDGGKANLISGDYTKAGGDKGDIYGENPSEKPNTATLSIPPQFTGTGVGSAVPATEIAASPTAIASTATDALQQTTGSVTTTGSTSATQDSAAASSSSTGAANHVIVSSQKSFGMSILSTILYGIYAL